MEIKAITKKKKKHPKNNEMKKTELNCIIHVKKSIVYNSFVIANVKISNSLSIYL